MRYFPVFMDLHRQPVLMVGGGKVAERKIRLLLQAGARIHLIARVLTENVQAWKQSGELIHVGETWNTEALAGMRLVFAATSDKNLNGNVFSAAEILGIPVNVVDDLSRCRFISPAIVDRSPVQVAISTGGTAPVLARRIRAWIEALLPQGLGKIADAAGGIRPEVKRRLRGIRARRFWEALLTDSRLLKWSNRPVKQIQLEMRSALNLEVPVTKPGRVYLVGAGPGRVELLTLRALEVLGRADVILHDRLVPNEILDLARRDADRIYVGKQSGNHHRTQQEIHDIMLNEVRQGRTVVRLKGGDAFIFGRGGEELEVLREHGVDYEVVPGITAAVGCAAYAGIPLTHRDHAQALTFVTGHLSSRVDSQAIDWSGITGPGKTTVVYMGIGQAENIQNKLLAADIAQDLPVALIMDGTRDSQRVIEGTVGQLHALALKADRDIPSLLIIGQVAALSSNLAWFEPPLSWRIAA